jgi:hypothetical protein
VTKSTSLSSLNADSSLFNALRPCSLHRFFSRDAPHHRRRVTALPTAGPPRSLLPLPPTAFPSYAAMLGSTVVLHVPPSVALPQIGVMSLHRWWWGASDRTRAVEEGTEGASRPCGWPGREQGSSASSPWVAPGSHAASCGEEEEGHVVPVADVSGWSKERRSRTPAASTPGGMGKGGGTSCRCRAVAGMGVVDGMGASGVPRMCGWPPHRPGLSRGARRRVRMWAAPHRALALLTRSAPPSIAEQER